MKATCPILKICAKAHRKCVEKEYADCGYYKACVLKEQKKRTKN